MSAHTPGPWLISASLPGGRDLGDGLYVQCFDGRAVAYASSGNKSDARLIAAAPELVEALEKICDHIATGDGAVFAAVEDIARAAIAKAEGRTGR